MKKTVNIFALILSILITSCKSDTTAPVPLEQTSAIALTFDNRISANQDLSLNTSTFVNQNNETVQTNELKYIISNITLTQDDGTIFEYPKEDSYFVINEEDPSSLQLVLSEIPIGNYTHISFGIGVDQSKYPLDGGVLNFIPLAEEAGMLWNWAAGYKFIKFEGMYTPQGGTASPFVIHVGSHGTNLDNYTSVTLPLGNSITVATGSTADINIDVFVENIIDATNQIKLEDTSDIQVDPVNAPRIAKNMESAFQAQ
ncbi:MbnP family protein [Kordia jejudonensis]|uniref:MbnP family protein n=1 Tax=Kordia jejudonensis TaxID=1348245 RepID=UPI000629421B|nr:MbnP family protein [Kordia jejudonensis]